MTKGRLQAFSDVALPIAFIAPYGSVAIYVAVAAFWFVPDRRMERALGR